MAMSFSQLGGIAGAPIAADSGSILSGEASKATVSAWKSPATTTLRCAVRAPGGETDRISPSPPVSPVMRGDLSAACKAFDEAVVEQGRYARGGGAQDKGKGVPVYVMMPLDSVNMGNGLNRRKAMSASLQALKSAGVEGIMMDVWWGLVERDEPGVYNWGGYQDLLELAHKFGLKVQAVMSFHQCGGNVGDSCT